jgi:hypothetical protein
MDLQPNVGGVAEITEGQKNVKPLPSITEVISNT